jgi:predicted transcriptional regulator
MQQATINVSSGSRGSVRSVKRLPPRLREIADLVWEKGEVSAAEVCRSLTDPVSNSAVRTYLRRLETKGLVQSYQEGNRYVYRPAIADEYVRSQALRKFTHEVYDGSFERLFQELKVILEKTGAAADRSS